jgi:hypothetical protein
MKTKINKVQKKRKNGIDRGEIETKRNTNRLILNSKMKLMKFRIMLDLIFYSLPFLSSKVNNQFLNKLFCKFQSLINLKIQDKRSHLNCIWIGSILAKNWLIYKKLRMSNRIIDISKKYINKMLIRLMKLQRIFWLNRTTKEKNKMKCLIWQKLRMNS